MSFKSKLSQFGRCHWYIPLDEDETSCSGVEHSCSVLIIARMLQGWFAVAIMAAEGWNVM